MIYNHVDATLVLGSLCKNPTILIANKYKLDKSDFSPCKFHEIIYSIIFNLAQSGMKEISPIDIGNFCEPYKPQMEILEDNDFITAISTFKELSNENNIEYYIDSIKKYSILRDYQANNWDISKFYDESKEDNNLTSIKIEDIISHYDMVQVEIKNRYKTDDGTVEYKACEDFAETKEAIKESPLVGGSFQSTALNSIYNGQYGFILRCGKSGSGKSVANYGDLMKVSCTHYWDDDAQDFVENKSFVGASLLISTELDVRKEIDPLLVSWCANVDRRSFRRGEYETKEIEDRYDRAGEIVRNSPIYVIDMPEFTMRKLEERIEWYVTKHDVKTVVFDYIQLNGYVNRELSSELNIPAREDLILLAETDRLKNLERRFGITILSGTQLNGKEDDMPYPTEACLAGGKSQIRKVDGCMIMLPPKPKELEALKLVYKKRGFEEPNCNRVTHIVKGRANEYEAHLKIFEYLDLGTCRSYFLACLDKDNKPYKLTHTIIENNS